LYWGKVLFYSGFANGNVEVSSRRKEKIEKKKKTPHVKNNNYVYFK
jgi:hypothetical protein